LAGIEVPVMAGKWTYGREPEESGWHRPDWFPPPFSAGFTQAYVGYGWQL
jgi:hypothetical protein